MICLLYRNCIWFLIAVVKNESNKSPINTHENEVGIVCSVVPDEPFVSSPDVIARHTVKGGEMKSFPVVEGGL